MNKLILYLNLLLTSILLSACCSHSKSMNPKMRKKEGSTFNEFRSKGDILNWREREYGTLGDTLSFQNRNYDVFSISAFEGSGFVTQRVFLFSKLKDQSTWRLLLERETKSKTIKVRLDNGNIVYKTSEGKVLMMIVLENIGAR